MALDRGWSQALDEFGSQGAGAASDIEDTLSVDDRDEFCERGRERPGIPAHESVVIVGADRETHGRGDYAPTLMCPSVAVGGIDGYIEWGTPARGRLVSCS